MMMSWFTFLLLSLAAFRLTRLVVYDKITTFLRKPFLQQEENILEDGTVEVLISIKGKGLRYAVGSLLSCYWCVGIWSAALLYAGWYFYYAIFMPLIIILAVAAVAAIIETIISYFL